MTFPPLLDTTEDESGLPNDLEQIKNIRGLNAALVHMKIAAIVRLMITVVIPTLNAERELTRTMAALVPAVVTGLVRRVVIADGGSSDDTLQMADIAGADVVASDRGRGVQLAKGAAQVSTPWILFIHADTILERGWEKDVSSFLELVDSGRRPVSAAAFRFSLDDFGLRPRILEKLVDFRCLLFRLPYGDQGLLISKQLYNEIGGFRDMPLMEDIDLIKRLGRKRITMLRTKAVTSAKRYKNDGYAWRVLRNAWCLLLYRLRFKPQTIARYYG